MNSKCRYSMDETIWQFAEVMFVILVSLTGIYLGCVLIAMRNFNKKLDILKSKLDNIDEKILLR